MSTYLSLSSDAKGLFQMKTNYLDKVYFYIFIYIILYLYKT